MRRFCLLCASGTGREVAAIGQPLLMRFVIDLRRVTRFVRSGSGEGGWTVFGVLVSENSAALRLYQTFAQSGAIS